MQQYVVRAACGTLLRQPLTNWRVGNFGYNDALLGIFLPFRGNHLWKDTGADGIGHSEGPTHQR
jgi:hypothetical protein